MLRARVTILCVVAAGVAWVLCFGCSGRSEGTGEAGSGPPAGASGAVAGPGPASGAAGSGGRSPTAATAGAGGATRDEASDEAAAECVFAVPAQLAELSGVSFFDHPWPSDYRVDDAGFVRVAGYPNPRPSATLEAYVAEAEGTLRGFSPAAAGYLRFTQPIDEQTLPAGPASTLAPDSAVQLIDVDPASPTRGERSPVMVRAQAIGDGSWPDSALAFLPALGVPLRPETRYALVVTDAVSATTGAVRACPALREVLGVEPPSSAEVEGLRAAWADAVELIESVGVPRSRLVHLTVFTTNDPTRDTRTLRDWVVEQYPPPAVAELWPAEQVAGVMDVYEGGYGPSPDFQVGTPPFLDGGGSVAWDDAGAPLVQRELDLRFVLTVPDAVACPPPAAGYPVALYAHGTGGDYRSAITNGIAGLLATRCIASLSIDQIFHGTRPGGPCAAGAPSCNSLPEAVAVFNAFNPTAMRSGNGQAAIDLVQQTRLVTQAWLAVPLDVSWTGQAIGLDPDRVMVMAHSQGATSAPLALAVDDRLRGGVLSGAAAMVSVSLLERSQPAGLAELMAAELGSSDAGADLDLFHPAISLLQTTLDPSDPLHYAPLIVTRPRDQFAAKSILMIEGVGADGRSDTYVSSHAIEVHALAMGLPPMQPLVWPIAELEWSSVSAVTAAPEGLLGNLAGGAASGALVQWQPPPDRDPHFVLFDVPQASEQAATFLESLAADPLARVPPR